MSNVVTEGSKSPLSEAFAREARVTSVKNPPSVDLAYQSHIREVGWNAAISCDVNHTYNENHINNIHDQKSEKKIELSYNDASKNYIDEDKPKSTMQTKVTNIENTDMIIYR